MMRTSKRIWIALFAALLAVSLCFAGVSALGTEEASGYGKSVRLDFSAETNLDGLVKRGADSAVMTTAATAAIDEGKLKIAVNTEGENQNVLFAFKDVKSDNFKLCFDLISNNAAFGVAFGLNDATAWNAQSSILTVLSDGRAFIDYQCNNTYDGYQEGLYVPSQTDIVNVEITFNKGVVTAYHTKNGDSATKNVMLSNGGTFTVTEPYDDVSQIGFWLSTFYGQAVSPVAVLDNVVLEYDEPAEEPVPDVTLEDFELKFDSEADLEKLHLFDKVNTGGGLPRAASPKAEIAAGALSVTTNNTEGYSWAEYRFGANALENYEITFEVEVKTGQLWLAGRVGASQPIADTALFYSMNAGGGGGQTHTQLMSRVGGTLDSSNSASYVALSGKNTVKLTFVNNQITYIINNNTDGGKSYAPASFKGVKGDAGFVVVNENATRAESVFSNVKFTNLDTPFDPDPQPEYQIMGASDFVATFASESDLLFFSGAFGAASTSAEVADGVCKVGTGSTENYAFSEFRIAAPKDCGFDMENFVFSADVKVNAGQLWMGGGADLFSDCMTQGMYFMLKPDGTCAVYARKDGELDTSKETETYHNFGTSTFRLTVKCVGKTMTVQVNDGASYKKTVGFDSLADVGGQFFLALVNEGTTTASAEFDNVKFSVGDREIDETVPSVTRGYEDTGVIKFDKSDETDAKAFADALWIRNVWGADGSAEFAEDGGLVLTPGHPERKYAMTEFRLGANNLGDYSVSMELEVLGGQLMVATRIPENANLFDGCYAAQFGYLEAGGMKSVNTVNCARTSDEVVQYTAYDSKDGSYKNLGITRFVVRVVMEGAQMRVYIGNDKNPTFNKLETGEYDLRYEGVRGDFALGIYNDNTPGKAILRKFRFENSVNDVWPSEDFVQPGLDYGAIDKIGDFTPKASYEKGETITLNLDEYFTYSGDGGFDTINFAVAGGIGSIADGKWSFTPDADGVYQVTITGSITGTNIRNSISFTVNVGAKEEEEPSGCGSCSGGGTAMLGTLLTLAALTVLKRR